jgi:hypothetical protein
LRLKLGTPPGFFVSHNPKELPMKEDRANVSINIRVSPSLAEALETAAAAEGLTPTAVVRRAVIRDLAPKKAQ